jgi:hypothetical protein
MTGLRKRVLLCAEIVMRRIVLVRAMSAMLLVLVGAGVSGCANAGRASTDGDQPGGGFGNTGRGFAYGR